MRLRAQVRAEEPMCRLCAAAGILRRTDEVDHITPLARGGTDDRANLQGLCKPHHDEKSAAERSGRSG